MKINNNGTPVVDLDLTSMSDNDVLEAIRDLPDDTMVQFAYRGPARRILPLLEELANVGELRARIIRRVEH